MAIDEATFKAAMAKMASGVTVITMRCDEEDHGFTATSFTSLSLSPMLVLVCVLSSHRNHDYLLRAGHYAVSFLGAADEALGQRFASSRTADRFSDLALLRAVTGAAILPGAVAWVDCKIRDVFPGGDHTIFVGEVLSGAANEGAPLLYYDRQWGEFAPRS